MATNNRPISAPATPALAAKNSRKPSGTIWRFSQPDNPVRVRGVGRVNTGPTAVAYTLFFRGLRTAAASTAALLALLEPLTGAILAASILGERLSATGIAGAVILAAAVIVTVRGADGGQDRVNLC